MTQLGGAVGVALLNSIAAATTAAPGAGSGTAATVAGFDASLLTGAAILGASALVVAAVVPTRTSRPAPDTAERA